MHRLAADVRRRLGRFARAAALPAAVILIGLAGLFHRFLFLNNFAVVDSGRVYRSAQPRRELGPTLADLGVGSVINLRGGSAGDDWYRDEVAATRARRVDFYDLHLSATARPSRCELLTLLDLLGRCRYPAWIHCKSGSDRTGLVSALYLLDRRGLPPERALEAFSVWRGHVPLFGPERLQEPIREYAHWLADRQLDHTPARLRTWIEREYRDDRPGDPEDCPPLRTGPRPQVVEGRERTLR